MADKTAIFPGSFDPITLGHLDMLIQGLNVAERVVVAIGVHAGKTPLFDFEERKELVLKSAQELELDLSRIDVISFDGLVVDAARQVGASIMLRGLRDSTDLNYEMQMAGMNGTLAPGLNTVLLPASPETRFITASLVRQIASMKGDVSSFVGEAVSAAIAQKFQT